MAEELHVTYFELTRQEKFRLWLKRHGSSYAALGRLLSVTRKSAIKIMNSEYVKQKRHDSLINVRINGEPIPDEMLPKLRSSTPDA